MCRGRIARVICRLVLPLATLALAFAGCGGDDGGGQGAGGGGGGGNGQQIGPPQDEFLRNTYDVAKDVCSEPPVDVTARQLGLPPSASEEEIADEYAKGSTPDHQPYAFDGCF